jgi:hypothetical protein
MNLATIDLMKRDGGDFAKAIARAWDVADPMNRARLETSFSRMFAVYSAAAEAKARQAQVSV